MGGPSESIIDKPSFWLGVVLLEAVLPMIIPNKRWAAIAMLAAALGCFGWADGLFGGVQLNSRPFPHITCSIFRSYV